MAFINFPGSPTVGQEFTDPNGIRWICDQTLPARWRMQVANNEAIAVSVDDAGGYYDGDNVEAVLQEIGEAQAGDDGRYVNITGDTISSSSPIRRIGVREAIHLSMPMPSIAGRTISVTMKPGDTELTRTPRSAHSQPSCSVTFRNAPLAAV